MINTQTIAIMTSNQISKNTERISESIQSRVSSKKHEISTKTLTISAARCIKDSSSLPSIPKPMAAM
nr:hypothetical protein [Candidatus Cloacimonadota bacterium]